MDSNTSQSFEKIVLAFSGGLDTSFCVPYLKELYSCEIITVTVDTSGFSQDLISQIEKRSKEVGADKHYTIQGVDEVYNKYIAYIIKGNILKGNKYPMCVGAERAVQAKAIVDIAIKENAQGVAHGSTGAGNDQIRFDNIIYTLAPDLEIITPIRDHSLSREYEIDFLQDHGIQVSSATKKYSINESIWGVTIGGGNIHDTWEEPPDDAYLWTNPIKKTPEDPEYISLTFNHGLPIELNDQPLQGPQIMMKLNQIGGKHGFGRDIHLGDTIIGIKGRIIFEAPATLALIEAHRELEKLVLTKQQLFWKSQLTSQWGFMLHHGMYLEPLMNDIQSFIDSSQQYVNGKVRLKFHKGSCKAVGVSSPFELTKKNLVYGESSTEWTGAEARAFAKIYSIQSQLANSARQNVKK